MATLVHRGIAVALIIPIALYQHPRPDEVAKAWVRLADLDVSSAARTAAVAPIGSEAKKIWDCHIQQL